jgi:hypothetical protein
MRTYPKNPYSADCFEAEIPSEGPSQLIFVSPIDLLEESTVGAKDFVKSRVFAKGLRWF